MSFLRIPHAINQKVRAFLSNCRTTTPRIRKLRPDELGAEYDTSWARRKPASLVRVLIIETISRAFVKALASPKTVGIESLDPIEGPAIFASNHASHLDTTLILTRLPRRFRHKAIVAAAADYFFDRQWKAALWALMLNIIPIEREKVGRKSAGLAADLINQGYNLVIFPEGTRSRDGSIAKFRGGAAYLGIRCAVPVVPVYLQGTGDIWQAGRASISRGRATVHFGKPLTPYPDERSRDFNDRIEAAVHELKTASDK